MARTKFLFDPDIPFPVVIFDDQAVAYVDKLKDGVPSLQMMTELSEVDFKAVHEGVVEAAKYMPDTFNAVLF